MFDKKEYQIKYRKEHKEETKKYSKEWREKNPESNIKSCCKWREKHKKEWEKENPNYQKEYTKEHGKERKKYHKRWATENPEKISFLNSKRRVRRLNAEGVHTLQEWQNLKAECDYTCPACGEKEPEIKLTEDHIIPLIKGGTDNIENIQPLCKSCNSKKHTQIVFYSKFF